MAYSFVQYESGGEATYAVTFPYLSTSHVTVYVEGVSVAFTWDSAPVVRPTVTPSSGDIVEIRRSSSRATRLGDYSDASILTEAAMDADALQMFYVAQEAFDAAANAIQLISDGTYDATSKRISNVDAAVAAGDAVNKAQLDAAALSPVTPTAGSIANIPSGNLAGDDVQEALNELQTDVDSRATTAAMATAIHSTIVDAKGDLIVATGADAVARMAVGNNGTLKMADSAEANGWRNWVPRNHISGLLVANSVSDASNDLDIAVGEAADDTAAYMLRLTSAMTKQADATWAAGTNAGGMLNGETIPAQGPLNVWLIYNPTTNTLDVGFNNHATSGLSPTLPSGYTIKRLIGTRMTTSSAFRPFVVMETAGGGEYLELVTAVPVRSGTLSTARVTFSCVAPIGYPVMAHGVYAATDAVAQASICFGNPERVDTAPVIGIEASTWTNTAAHGVGRYHEMTDDTGYMFARSSLASSDGFSVSSMGWEWSRRL